MINAKHKHPHISDKNFDEYHQKKSLSYMKDKLFRMLKAYLEPNNY